MSWGLKALNQDYKNADRLCSVFPTGQVGQAAVKPGPHIGHIGSVPVPGSV